MNQEEGHSKSNKSTLNVELKSGMREDEKGSEIAGSVCPCRLNLPLYP